MQSRIYFTYKRGPDSVSADLSLKGYWDVQHGSCINGELAAADGPVSPSPVLWCISLSFQSTSVSLGCLPLSRVELNLCLNLQHTHTCQMVRVSSALPQQATLFTREGPGFLISVSNATEYNSISQGWLGDLWGSRSSLSGLHITLRTPPIKRTPNALCGCFTSGKVD